MERYQRDFVVCSLMSLFGRAKCHPGFIMRWHIYTLFSVTVLYTGTLDQLSVNGLQGQWGAISLEHRQTNNKTAIVIFYNITALLILVIYCLLYMQKNVMRYSYFVKEWNYISEIKHKCALWNSSIIGTDETPLIHFEFCCHTDQPTYWEVSEHFCKKKLLPLI